MLPVGAHLPGGTGRQPRSEERPVASGVAWTVLRTFRFTAGTEHLSVRVRLQVWLQTRPAARDPDFGGRLALATRVRRVRVKAGRSMDGTVW